MLQVRHLRARQAYARGYSAWAGGDLEAALELLDACLRRQPDHLGAFLARARVLSELDRPDDAAAKMITNALTTTLPGMAFHTNQNDAVTITAVHRFKPPGPNQSKSKNIRTCTHKPG